VQRCTFEAIGENLDHDLGRITDTCFAGADAATDAVILCQQLKGSFLAHRAYEFNYTQILTSLFRTQPLIALDEFLGDKPQNGSEPFIWDIKFYRKNPLDEVPAEILIAWAQMNPPFRFLNLASAITPFTNSDSKAEPAWTSTALQLLSFAPDRALVLTEYTSHFHPISWSGSLADILESRRSLLCVFLSDTDPQIVTWAQAQDAALGEMATQARSSERQRDERFE